MAAKKPSSDKATDDTAAPADGTPEALQGTDPVMDAAVEPRVELVAPEHDPRPEGMELATPVHDPRPEDMDIAAPVTPEPEPITATTPPPPPPTEVEKSGGFLPAFLGGLIAAAIGFGLGFWLVRSQQPDLEEQVAAFEQQLAQQRATIEELRGQVGQGPDLTALDGKLAAMGTDLTQASNRLDAMAGDVQGMTGRLDELEKRPVSENVSPDAIAAYEAELERLKQAMQDQRGEVEALVEQAKQMESDANATAEATMRRAALTRILSSLDTGAPYDTALADLQAAGQDVPEALASGAASGVPSLAELRETYPEAARRALSAARRADTSTGNFTDFLRDNLGARSLTPREGDDPDAILSRAESALKQNHLSDALAELESLPDAARAEMSGWIEDAKTRAAAVSAAEELNTQLSDS